MGYVVPYPGQFLRLHLLATDSKGNVYTSEANGGKVNKWTFKGSCPVSRDRQQWAYVRAWVSRHDNVIRSVGVLNRGTSISKVKGGRAGVDVMQQTTRPRSLVRRHVLSKLTSIFLAVVIALLAAVTAMATHCSRRTGARCPDSRRPGD